MEDLVQRRLKGRSPRNVLGGLGQALFFAGTGNLLPDEREVAGRETLEEKMALEQFKSQNQLNDPYKRKMIENIDSLIESRKRAPLDTAYGYDNPEDIPEEVGGLPRKSVRIGKGNKYIPTYGYQQPMFGGFDMQGMVDSFNQPQTPYYVQPSQADYGLDDAPDLDAIMNEAGYGNMSEEDQEEFLAFLESRYGGQNGQ